MSRSRSNKPQQPGRAPGQTARPTTGARSTRIGTLLVLLCVVLIVALLMVGSLVGFVLNPDPAVKAGPMYVTLALTTAASLLMLVLALNASFLPILSREQAPNLTLVMVAMGVTGVVTGLLTVGGAASPYVTRLVLASIAFAFIAVQNTRLTRAREAARAGQADPPARQTQPRPRSRQRRGGRKQ